MDAATLRRAASLRMKVDSRGRVPTYDVIAKALGLDKREVAAELKEFFAAVEAALANGIDMQLPWAPGGRPVGAEHRQAQRTGKHLAAVQAPSSKTA